MAVKNITVEISNIPELDKGFVPFGKYIDAYKENAKKLVSVAVFRNRGFTSVFDTKIHGTPDMREADFYYIERLVKMLLWCRGGAKVVIYGDDEIAGRLSLAYSEMGTRSFDSGFMANVYDMDFTVQGKKLAEKVVSSEESVPVGGNWNGCRIGFDAGGSDRKVSAVIDGETVYSEEVIWHPKTASDPDYHYGEIVNALKTAASKMPRVDAIGVSSAGIYIDNLTKVASLFIKVSKDQFDLKVKDIYIRAAKEIGDIPLVVANDGDVTALAGAAELGDGSVLGIAMGTSEAAGYVDSNMNLAGWLNELAFAPVDCSPDAPQDEWSGDIGCGCKYFSQDGVIRLAEHAGIPMGSADTPAAKLKVVQGLLQESDERAAAVFRSIGVYLGHTIPLYGKFYDIKHLLLLGRVTSGEGGVIILNEAKRVIDEEYPLCKVNINLPDESSRRVGQSVMAASLPVLL